MATAASPARPGPEARDVSERCWWNLSSVATLVLGLPDLKVHSATAPPYVHRVGPTLWAPGPVVEPSWLSVLGRGRPAVRVALSTNPVPDAALAVLGAQACSDRFDVVVTAGAKGLPDLPTTVVGAGDFPHSGLVGRVSAIICSAGYGTVTRAGCSGTPVLAVPFMGDQPLVAQAVVQARLGLSSLGDELSVEGLRASLDELMAWDKRPLDRLETAAQTYQAAHLSADLVEALIEQP